MTTSGPCLKRLVYGDGTFLDTEIGPPVENNLIYTVEDAVRMYRRDASDGASIWIGREEMTVFHDSTRTRGRSVCKYKRSDAVQAILDNANRQLTPEQFESTAKLLFDADREFLTRLRSLRWNTKMEQSARISNASKSADISEIAQVVDENYGIFQDVTMTVSASYFIDPIVTEPHFIELNAAANAEKKYMLFFPKPGTMETVERIAMMEVVHEVRQHLEEEEQTYCFVGQPDMGDEER